MSTAAAVPEPTTLPQPPQVRLTRFLRASRQRVFDAWTNPEQLKQWMGPHGFTCPVADSDPRPGGRHHLHMVSDAASCTPGEASAPRESSTTGEYLEVNPPELIRFTWNPSLWPDEHTVVTVRLKEVAGGTELELLHERFVSPIAAQRHTSGWNGCLDKLGAFTER